MAWVYWRGYKFGAFPSTLGHANPEAPTIILDYPSFDGITSPLLSDGDVIRLARIRTDQVFSIFDFILTGSTLDITAHQSHFGLAYVEETEGSGTGEYPGGGATFMDYLCTLNIDGAGVNSRVDLTDVTLDPVNLVRTSVGRRSAKIADVWAQVVTDELVPQYLDLVQTVTTVGTANPANLLFSFNGYLPFKTSQYSIDFLTG